MRPSLRWVIAFLAVSLAGVAVDAVRATGEARAPSSLQSAIAHAVELSPVIHATMPGVASPLAAAFVLQADDCSGNLRMLNLLHRRDVQSALALQVLWYSGSVADSTLIRVLLPAWTARIPLRPVPHFVVTELARLGHHSSPVLVVADDSGRIRFTTQSPRSAREFAGLQRIIAGLTWSEER